MNRYIEIDKKEFEVLGSEDDWGVDGLHTRIVLKTDSMTYGLDREEIVVHFQDGYCVFCNDSIKNSSDDFICSNGIGISTEDITQAKQALMFEWINSLGHLTYEILHQFANLDTYHFVLQFKENKKIAEVILHMDGNYNVVLKDIKGSIPEPVITYIKGIIVPELTEENRLDIITSCFPLTVSIIEYLLKRKCNETVRYEILSEVNSIFKRIGRNFSEEEEIREILRCYIEDEYGDRERIADILKRSLVKIPWYN